MTHRLARKSLGSRVSRRSGTKTKVRPGAAGKRPPKFRYPRRQKPRPAVLVARKVKESR